MVKRSILLRRIEAARVRAAESAVVASIPADLLKIMSEAQAKFEAEGGCKGCRSMCIGVHYMPCKEAGYD